MKTDIPRNHYRMPGMVSDQVQCRSSEGPLFYQLEIVQLPGFVDIAFQRTIKAEHHKPALAGYCLDPIIVLTIGHLGPEVYIDAAIGVDLGIAGAANGNLPPRIEQTATRGVVGSDGPETFHRRLGGYPQPIVFTAIQISTGAIPESGYVSRTYTGSCRYQIGRNHDCLIVPKRTRINVGMTIFRELGIAHEHFFQWRSGQYLISESREA